jgi:hypothetical protein
VCTLGFIVQYQLVGKFFGYATHTIGRNGQPVRVRPAPLIAPTAEDFMFVAELLHAASLPWQHGAMSHILASEFIADAGAGGMPKTPMRRKCNTLRLGCNSRLLPPAEYITAATGMFERNWVKLEMWATLQDLDDFVDTVQTVMDQGLDPDMLSQEARTILGARLHNPPAPGAQWSYWWSQLTFATWVNFLGGHAVATRELAMAIFCCEVIAATGGHPLVDPTGRITERQLIALDYPSVLFASYIWGSYGTRSSLEIYNGRLYLTTLEVGGQSDESSPGRGTRAFAEVNLGMEPVAGPVMYAALNSWIAGPSLETAMAKVQKAKLQHVPGIAFADSDTQVLWLMWQGHMDRSLANARISGNVAYLGRPFATWGLRDQREQASYCRNGVASVDLYLRILGIGLDDAGLVTAAPLHGRGALENRSGPYAIPDAAINDDGVFSPTEDHPAERYVCNLCPERNPKFFFPVQFGITTSEPATWRLEGIEVSRQPESGATGSRTSEAVFDIVWEEQPVTLQPRPNYLPGGDNGDNRPECYRGSCLPSWRARGAVVHKTPMPMSVSVGTWEEDQGWASAITLCAGEVAGTWVAPTLCQGTDTNRMLDELGYRGALGTPPLGGLVDSRRTTTVTTFVAGQSEKWSHASTVPLPPNAPFGGPPPDYDGQDTTDGISLLAGFQRANR